jgi:hypothetical protein
MPNLNPTEIEMIAALANDPAYLLLLTKVEVLLEELEDKMASDSDNRETFFYWKAMRTIYLELKETPQAFSQIVAEIKPEEAYKRDVNPKITQDLKTFFLKLQGIKALEEKAVASVAPPPTFNARDFSNLI